MTSNAVNRLVEHVLARQEASQCRKIRQLLDENDNQVLAAYVREQYQKQQENTGRLADAINILQTARRVASSKSFVSRSEIYVEVLSKTKDSAGDLERDLLLSIKRLPSNKLEALLAAVVDLHLDHAPVPREFLAAQEDLASLIDAQNAQLRPLRSAHEGQHSSMRTRVVGQKVELAHQREIVSERDAEYSELLSGVHGLFSFYFRRNLRNPSRTFLAEVFFYDLRAPHRAAFTPKPRYAIERALSTPHDYLGCDCCGSMELSKTQPPTAILYQLYLESGQLINVRDMWESFHAIVRDDSTVDDEFQERQHL
jgi:origin recognition complex subunit 3